MDDPVHREMTADELIREALGEMDSEDIDSIRECIYNQDDNVLGQFIRQHVYNYINDNYVWRD